MTRRLAVLLALVVAACGGHQQASTLAPQTLNTALTQFLDAVKANDLVRMGRLWGDERGPAESFMKPDELHMKLATIQKYLSNRGYRIIEGPMPAQPLDPTYRNVPALEKMRDFRVELQREQCNTVIPITLVRTGRGGWVVYDVHLESASNPRAPCPPQSSGTRP